ncbi:MAG: hypothetical protein IJR87_04890 [Bacteroidaceae bacterium]|nr:hypothetical protein [Bacteroidaceae bacterium]
MTRVSRRTLCLAALLIAGMASRAIARTPGQDSIVHAEVMAWSNITGVRLEGELIDFESTLRVGVPGQRMEQSGRERQSRIRYHREGNTQTTLTPMHVRNRIVRSTQPYELTNSTV